MNGDNPDMEAFFARLKSERKKTEREDLLNTAAMAAIAAGLAFWAYHSLAHAVLFGFVVFAVCAVGNKVVGEMRKQQAKDEGRRPLEDRRAVV